MKRKRHTQEQVIRILREAEASGLNIEEAAKQAGVSEGTYFRWKRKYGGMDVAEAKRLKELETENGRLKKLLAERDLEVEILKEVAGKKW